MSIDTNGASTDDSKATNDKKAKSAEAEVSEFTPETAAANETAASSAAPSTGRASVAARRAAAKGESLSSEVSYPVEISIRTLLEVGAHFGHQTQKWNPKMLPHIYCAKNGIHILNLDGTLGLWEKARKFIVDTISRGGSLLYVGTKIQARDIVQEEAARSGSFYVTTRWLGGTLSNFQTIKNSIDRMRKLEELLVQSETDVTKVKITKKEKLEITREVGKLEQSLGGIRMMKRPPDALFVIDVLKETIAVQEARRLRIPVIALTDTNANPDRIEYPIPSNDDASRTIRLFSAAVGDAVIEGRAAFNARPAREKQELLQVLEGRAHVQTHSSDSRDRPGRGGRGGRGGGGGGGGFHRNQPETHAGADKSAEKPAAPQAEAKGSADTSTESPAAASAESPAAAS